MRKINSFEPINTVRDITKKIILFHNILTKQVNSYFFKYIID